ncbi:MULTISPECIES: glutamate racemase [Methylobacterium]|uniref:Glutamate racemase n=3 Tax=Pseudomonadota TaxID=1224 RepID=A0ABQ4T1V7_9HYPH|nr:MULTISPECIES: glutamate racemase [Methylobacterium]PIU04111.1 MAG: glutamate racemase [Methylobacterium sp. CG09_land_8_20_14_0_10_71_15]PIU11649.1 MAG: glutamate racemase [Methylobacterium sp. CG08_land_8_20_14_0_20_71_15]GBU17647.1 glutamate racemase [Methylobacterium sp.]GJE08225.1 Glutamate racemase [Methylobacterium jeotgali]
MRIDLMAGASLSAVAPRVGPPPNILVFDSGLGGLTVLDQVRRARPDASFVYAADTAAFPYGRLSEETLVARVLAVMERLLARHRPDLAVIACNTASTLVLPALRQRFATPFVGVVPPIKPAAEATRSRLVSLLATPGTVARAYTHDLIASYAGACAVTLVGSKNLAAYAEAEMAGEPVSDESIAAEIAPCFVTAPDGRRTDVVCLSCTHYPLLLPRFERLAPWPVRWIDPAPAIARRVVQLLGPGLPGAADPDATVATAFTGATVPGAALRASLAARGLRELTVEAMPLALQ